MAKKKGAKRSRQRGKSNGAEIVPADATASELLPSADREDLVAWFNLYMGIEGSAGSDNTLAAKKADLEVFLGYLGRVAGITHPDGWTRSVTQAFLKHLERVGGKSPSTINRVLATLKHAAKWIHRNRPFLAGNPCARIGELQTEAPEWKGLTDVEITRLRSAAEQRLHLKRRRTEQPLRDFAVFMVLLHTALRISELLALRLDQFEGKHFLNVKRKGRIVSRKVFVAKDAREVLDRYLEEERSAKSLFLFCTSTGKPIDRQAVDRNLKRIAAQANAHLPPEEHMKLSAHVLRHTLLRKAANKHGVHYAKELSGHASDRYIWRYVQPSDEEKERAVEELL